MYVGIHIPVKVNSQVFREAFTVHYIGILGSLGAGLILSGLASMLETIPGLALLLPGALGARGTIHSALGSRLSSAIHLGRAGDFSFHNPVIRENANITHKATLFISLILACIGLLLGALFHISANPFLLIFISIAGGAVAGIVLIFITNIVAFQTFKRGWDPDNLTAPLIATLGDFITVPVLFGFAFVAIRMRSFILMAVVALMIPYVVWEVKKYMFSARFLVLIPSITFQVIAGIFLERSLPTLLMRPGILAFIPVFLAQGGNLSSIFAARLSTQLHLGTLKPEFTLKGSMVNEIATIIILGTLIFPFLGVTIFLIQLFFGLPHMQILEILRIVLEAGFLNIIIVVLLLGFLLSILSWRLHLDPDDVTIPLLSALADLFGILFLLLVL